MLQAGSIVTVHRLGDTAWVIKCREADGLYRVICRTTTPRWPNTRGHFYSSRVVGEGDLALVAPAPVYEVGTTLEHKGVQYTVAADLDEHVELIVPPSRFRLKRGALHVPGGQPHHRRQERPNTGGFEMNEKDFFELELRAQIVPQQARWPAPEHVHWQRLHAVADEARERVSNAYMLMDEIDRNADLSPEGKEGQRRKVAAQAIAEFEASKTLVRAREAVNLRLDHVAAGRD